jgi:hypothetical protein
VLGAFLEQDEGRGAHVAAPPSASSSAGPTGTGEPAGEGEVATEVAEPVVRVVPASASVGRAVVCLGEVVVSHGVEPFVAIDTLSMQ